MSMFWSELFGQEVDEGVDEEAANERLTTKFLILMTLVQIPLSWIQEIRHLTITNALANSLIMYGLILCLAFSFEEAIVPAAGEDGGERGAAAELFYKFFHLQAFNSDGWFLFIGTSVSLKVLIVALSSCINLFYCLTHSFIRQNCFTSCQNRFFSLKDLSLYYFPFRKQSLHHKIVNISPKCIRTLSFVSSGSIYFSDYSVGCLLVMR